MFGQRGNHTVDGVGQPSGHVVITDGGLIEVTGPRGAQGYQAVMTAAQEEF